MDLSPPQFIDETNDAVIFRWYAGADLDKWKELLGMTLDHQTYGPGELNEQEKMFVARNYFDQDPQRYSWVRIYIT